MGKIVEYRERRKAAEDALWEQFENERRTLVQELRSRITPGLEKWWEIEGFSTIDDLLKCRESSVEILENFRQGRAKYGSIRKVYKAQNFSPYGFMSLADARSKLSLLRYAWRALVKIEIVERGEEIHLTFTAL